MSVVRHREPIPGYKGWYEIDTDGVVYSVCRKKEIIRRPYILKSNRSSDYLRIRLQKEGVSRNKLIHRLVAETYIPNPNNLPQVNHKDKDTLNNNVSNLEWVTGQQNQEHDKGKIRTWEHPIHGREVVTASEMARKYGLSVGNLSMVSSSKRKQHKGWKFVNESIGA